MKCAGCESTIPSEARFCPYCGRQVDADKSIGQTHSAILSSNNAKPDASAGKAQAHNPAMAQTPPRAAGSPQLPSVQRGPVRVDQRDEELKAGRKGRNRSKLLLSFMALLVVVVFEVIGVLVAELIDVDYEMPVVAAASIGAALGIIALGGARSLIPSRQTLRNSLRYGWWLLAANGLLALFDIAALVFEPEYALADSWLADSLWVLFYCLFVGINEELMFRGLLLGGLLSKLGDTRRGVLAACLISTVLFACAHVDWFTLNYADPLELIQAVLKIIQMCIFGLLMSSLVLSSNNLVGSSLLHALGDFLLLLPSIGLMGVTLEVSYVSSGSDALPTIMLYLFVIVLYLPMLFSSIRSLRKMDTPQYGPLHKDRTATHS